MPFTPEHLRTHKKRREQDEGRPTRVATHPRREARRQRAAERQEACDALTPQERLARLTAEGHGSGREAARLRAAGR